MRLIAFIGSMLALCVAHAEPPPNLRAADLLPAAKLAGAHYTIAQDVGSDGFLLDFVVFSDFGPFHARGPGLIDRRIAEVQSLVALESMGSSAAFKEGFANAAKFTAHQVGDIVTDPAATLTGIPAGVGRFFSRTTLTAQTHMTQINDQQAAQNRNLPAPGPEAKLPGLSAAPAPVAVGSTSVEAAKMTGGVVADAFGYARVRRTIAQSVNADPYTTNLVLRARLDELGRVALLGNLGVSAIKASVPESFLVGAVGVASTWVWDTLPGDILVSNQRALLAMGASQQQVAGVINHALISLTLQVRLVRALQRLKGVTGLSDALTLVSTTTSEEQAEFVINTVEMLAYYHEKKAPLVSVHERGTLLGQTAQAELVLVAPVDYVLWTASLGQFLDHDDLKSGKRSLWLTGRLSPPLLASLQAAGWQVTQNLDWAPVLPQALTAGE